MNGRDNEGEGEGRRGAAQDIAACYNRMSKSKYLNHANCSPSPVSPSSGPEGGGVVVFLFNVKTTARASCDAKLVLAYCKSRRWNVNCDSLAGPQGTDPAVRAVIALRRWCRPTASAQTRARTSFHTKAAGKMRQSQAARGGQNSLKNACKPARMRNLVLSEGGATSNALRMKPTAFLVTALKTCS